MSFCVRAQNLDRNARAAIAAPGIETLAPGRCGKIVKGVGISLPDVAGQTGFRNDRLTKYRDLISLQRVTTVSQKAPAVDPATAARARSISRAC